MLFGFGVQQDTNSDGDGAQATEKGHRVVEQNDRDPDEESSLHCVGHTAHRVPETLRHGNGSAMFTAVGCQHPQGS